jgi:hypothetical protein
VPRIHGGKLTPRLELQGIHDVAINASRSQRSSGSPLKAPSVR